MARKKATESGTLEDLWSHLSKVDSATFARMVLKSGLPMSEAQELCRAFAALKG